MTALVTIRFHCLEEKMQRKWIVTDPAMTAAPGILQNFFWVSREREKELREQVGVFV